MYFVKANSLFKRFDIVNIKYVPQIENMEANDLAHIASRYRVSKEKFEGLTEVKDKLITVNVLSP